jgi:hypothetical protein
MAVKKNAPWVNWFFGIGITFFALVMLLLYSLPDTPESVKPSINSWNDWVKHRDYVLSLSKAVISSDDATNMYLQANSAYEDKYSKNCRLDACSEYRGFLRAARDASEDGVLTPKELLDVARSYQLMTSTIEAKNEEFKLKFNYKEKTASKHK